MKQLLILYAILICISVNPLKAQSTEAQQLLLNVEKLVQLKTILNNMKKGYEVLSAGYNTINDITKGNFSLHDLFLDALLQVSPAIRKYKRVADIIASQTQIVKEYRAAFNRFKASNLFNSDEISYMQQIYQSLFRKSLHDLDELTIVITAGKLRMSDDERITAIDQIYKAVSDKLFFLRRFNNEGAVLAVQRGREMVDTRLSQKINGF